MYMIAKLTTGVNTGAGVGKFAFRSETSGIEKLAIPL